MIWQSGSTLVPTVTIVSLAGAVTLDFDDTVDIVAILTEELTILSTRGAGTAHPDRGSAMAR